MPDTLVVGRSITSDVTLATRTQSVRPRGDRDGSAYVKSAYGSRLWPTGDAGSYYMGCNPTKLTAVTGTIVAAYAATTPDLIIRNGDSAGTDGSTGRRIYLDYIRLRLAVAPASATAAYAYFFVDDKAGGRYSSGGSTIVPVCTNVMETNDGSTDTVKVGALTASAAGANERYCGQVQLRGQIPVVLDQYTIVFGPSGKDGAAGGVITSANNLVFHAAPIVIPPQCDFLLHFAFPSNAATAYTAEWDIGYVKA